MDSLDGIVDVSKYLGDSSKADWVAQGEPLLFNGNVLLTMPAHSVGTVLASTTYMWYGNVKAKVKTSRGAGVVTAFILLSDVKDEIDYEWVGADLSVAQTNYYFQGIPECKLYPAKNPIILQRHGRLTLLQMSTAATSQACPTHTKTSTSTRFNGRLTQSPGSWMAK